MILLLFRWSNGAVSSVVVLLLVVLVSTLSTSLVQAFSPSILSTTTSTTTRRQEIFPFRTSTTPANAHRIIYQTKITDSSTRLKVSIGLGPDKNSSNNSTATTTEDGTLIAEEAERELIAGVDYDIPNHEAHRMDRVSALDQQCDDWFRALVPANDDKSKSSRTMAGPLTESMRERLLTPPPIVVQTSDTIITDPSNDDWTPYVTTKLPWSLQSPPYGLEQFGLPTPRRNAEAWRTFDVPGMIAQSIIVSSTEHGNDDTTGLVQQQQQQQLVQHQLRLAGAWLDDADCSARLIYVNGIFCPALSRESHEARNVASVETELFASNDNDTDPASTTTTSNDELRRFLSHLPDGHSDELVAPVPMQQGAPSLTHLASLSGPNHNVGPATSQFAMNAQQGTACFAALNTIACQHMAYIHCGVAPTPPPTTSTSTSPLDKPILIVYAVTPNGGVSVAQSPPTEATVDTTSSGPSLPPPVAGVAIHPRTVIVVEAHSHASVVQQSVSIPMLGLENNNENANDSKLSSSSSSDQSRPILYNGYTQVLLKDYANLTHTLIEESGGLPVPGTEDSNADAARELESQRPALRNTVLETLDVHCAGTESSYTGTVLSMGGNGRALLSTSITLLKPTARCNLQGFALTGGSCRAHVKTNLHHIADHCDSRQLQKNMVAGRAVGSFRGRIRVEQSAQQTNAQQLSRTVVLTDKCRAWSVPSLEIIADDVQCTHGATVSDLSEEELFYLRSRGLSVAAARNLLMYAFGNDVLVHVPPVVLGGALSPYTTTSSNDDATTTTSPGLQLRIMQRLENLVPTGKRAMQGEYQSI